MLRSYHSEQVREGQWERLFSRKLRSVVPMNPEYLARNDGSIESAGRGSGLEKEKPTPRPTAIPYMQMTFAPLERRLDTAIFRALFASSARQARQFVVHGAVKVNGKKVPLDVYIHICVEARTDKL
jgi:ribosomal protein S4